MKNIYIVGVMAMTGLLFLTGCGQPNVNNYVNPKIKNQNLKKEIFKYDNQKCQLYAYRSVPNPTAVVYPYSYGSGSGTFDMTNTATGAQYSGTYRSGGGFSRGLARGSAVGQSMVNSYQSAAMKSQAWALCMIRSGWRDI